MIDEIQLKTLISLSCKKIIINNFSSSTFSLQMFALGGYLIFVFIDYHCDHYIDHYLLQFESLNVALESEKKETRRRASA